MHPVVWALLLAATPQADNVEQALIRSRTMPERPGEVAFSTAVASSQLVPGEAASGLRVPISVAVGLWGRLDLRMDGFLTQVDGSVEKLHLGTTVGGFRVGTRVALARSSEGVLSVQARLGAWSGVTQDGGLLPAFDLQLRAAGHAGLLVLDGGLGATAISLRDVSTKLKLGLVPVPEADLHAGLALGPVLLGGAIEAGVLVDELDAAGVFAGPEIEILVAGRFMLVGFASLTGQRATSVSMRVDLGR